jgi:hypothetical protein
MSQDKPNLVGWDWVATTKDGNCMLGRSQDMEDLVCTMQYLDKLHWVQEIKLTRFDEQPKPVMTTDELLEKLCSDKEAELRKIIETKNLPGL